MLPIEFDSEGTVKHQYVGDINDYRKYALLRALSAGGANRMGQLSVALAVTTVLTLGAAG